MISSDKRKFNVMSARSLLLKVKEAGKTRGKVHHFERRLCPVRMAIMPLTSMGPPLPAKAGSENKLQWR